MAKRRTSSLWSAWIGQARHYKRAPSRFPVRERGRAIQSTFRSIVQTSPFAELVQVHPPEGATAYRVLLKRWRGKGVPRVVSVDQRAVLGHGAQVELVTQHINKALRSMESKYGFHSRDYAATTKAIEPANRISRPQALAQEFARQGFIVFYVYHRSVNTAPLPDRNFDGIVQLPNDIFQILAPRIARTQAKRFRISLFSIPDHNSVRQLGVFQRFGWRTIYEVRDDWERRSRQSTSADGIVRCGSGF
jgi:hypothetical protein